MAPRTRFSTPVPLRSPQNGDRFSSRRFAVQAIVGLAALIAGAALAASPAAADVTSEDVEEARRQAAEVTVRLQAQVERYEDAAVQEALLQERVDGLVADLEAQERHLAALRETAREHVVDVYMSAAGETPSMLPLEGRFHEAAVRQVYLESVAETDREVINRLAAAQGTVETLHQSVAAGLEEQEALRNEMEDVLEEVYAELETANAAYQEVKAQWDRQEAERLALWLSTSTTLAAPAAPTTTIGSEVPPAPDPPPQPGVLVCPVDGAVTFTDDWGDPRSGGRTHTGTDLWAAAGTPLVAIESGTIWSPNWHWAGGNGLYVNGDSGDRWYYAHMQGYAPGIADGVRVSAGQLVGYVGSTGNAVNPHLHLGYLPGAAYYANPYPMVASVCL